MKKLRWICEINLIYLLVNSFQSYLFTEINNQSQFGKNRRGNYFVY